jgi:hypothetical protein
MTKNISGERHHRLIERGDWIVSNDTWKIYDALPLHRGRTDASPKGFPSDPPQGERAGKLDDRRRRDDDDRGRFAEEPLEVPDSGPLMIEEGDNGEWVLTVGDDGTGRRRKINLKRGYRYKGYRIGDTGLEVLAFETRGNDARREHERGSRRMRDEHVDQIRTLGIFADRSEQARMLRATNARNEKDEGGQR